MDQYTQTSHHGKKGRMKFSKNVVMWLLLVLLLAAAVGTAAYYVNKYNDSKKEVARLSNPTEVAKQEKATLIAKVASLTQLPAGDPTIATVTDITKLKDQKFFENAQNGDKLLIYTKSKKAILYRPSTNKIINIAPLTIGASQNKSSNQTQNQNQNTTP